MKQKFTSAREAFAFWLKKGGLIFFNVFTGVYTVRY